RDFHVTGVQTCALPISPESYEENTMLKRLLTISGIAIVLVLATVGYMLFRTPAAASGPITAIPIAPTSAVVEARATTASTSAARSEERVQGHRVALGWR